MANLRYFHLAAVNFTEATRIACAKRHADEQPGTELGVTPTADGDEVLVKMQGAGKAWRAEQAWIPLCLHVYDRDDRGKRFSDLDFYSAKWQGDPPK